ncbi:MAG: YicC family protein, partial [Planctomycetaceae bacterium]
LLRDDVLSGYWQQISGLAKKLQAPEPKLSDHIELPGVIAEGEESKGDSEADWPQIEDALRKALDRFQEFRKAEGLQMEQELRANCKVIETRLTEISALAPGVAREYRDKLHQRLKEMLSGSDVTISESDLIREVSIYADRCDINEEVTRLRSHIEQFEAFVLQKESTGRKLEFLGQEMFREVNTIGSKANNIAIAHSVVEMKASIEKMREILQNVE